MTFSKREKRMLYMLGCFLMLSASIYIFILPAFKAQAALSEQLKTLEAQRLVRVQSIARMGDLDNHVKALRKEIETRSVRYAPPMLSEALDKQFTAMLRRYNAVPMEFTIGEVNSETAIAYYGERKDFGGVELTIADVPPLEEYMAAVNTTPKGTVVPEDEEIAQTTTDVDAPTTKAQALTINAIMSSANATAFLEELSSDPAIIVNNVDIASVVTLTVGATGETSVASGDVNITVEFLSLLAPDLPADNTDTEGAPNITFS